MVTLMVGGARSGKSRYAQQIAEATTNVLFVATAEARDDAEMSTKIAHHKPNAPLTGTPSKSLSIWPAPSSAPPTSSSSSTA